MNVIFGFGQADNDAANKLKSDLSTYLKNELEMVDFDTLDCFGLKKICDKFQESRPKFKGKNKEWNHCWICFPRFAKEHDILAILEVKYSAYNENHPFSPDGFACLDIPFNLSILIRKNPEQEHDKSSCLYQERVEIFS